MRAALVTKALTYGPCTKVRQWLDIQGKALYQCIISKYIMLIKYLATCHPLLTVSGKPRMHGECTVHSSCGAMLSNQKVYIK